MATVDPGQQTSYTLQNGVAGPPFGGAKPFTGTPNLWIVDITTNTAPVSCGATSSVCGSNGLGNNNNSLVYYTHPLGPGSDIYLVIETSCLASPNSWGAQPPGYNQSCTGTVAYQIIGIAPPPPSLPSPPPPPPSPPPAPSPPAPPAPLYPPNPLQSPPPAPSFPPARDANQSLPLVLYHGWTPPASVASSSNFNAQLRQFFPCLTTGYDSVLSVAGGVFGCAKPPLVAAKPLSPLVVAHPTFKSSLTAPPCTAGTSLETRLSVWPGSWQPPSV